MKRFPSNKPQFCSIWYICLLLIIVGLISYYLGFHTHKISPADSQIVIENDEKSSLCSSNRIIEQTIRDSFPEKQHYIIRNYHNSINKDFLWQNNSNEPAVYYGGENASDIYLLDQDIDEVYSTFKLAIQPKLEEKGFTTDQIVTRPLVVSETVINNGYDIHFIFGFHYKDELYRLEGTRAVYDARENDPNQHALPAHTIAIKAYCGRKNAELEAQYAKLIQTRKYTNNDAIRILPENSKDNVLVLDKTPFMNGLACCSGVAQYWSTKNDIWEFLFETQASVACEIFETRKIGKGLTCYDKKIEKDRDVKYSY